MGGDGFRLVYKIAKRGAIAVCLLISTLAATTANALTQIDFISDPGDYIGGGRTFSLTLADGTISAVAAGSGIHVQFRAVPTPGISPKTFWDLNLVPVENMSLVPGNYPSAQRWPFQSPKRPGLDVEGDGRGCNILTGKFTVHEAVFDIGGNVVAFAADAEQHCDSAAAALRVRIRFNTNVPLQLQLPQAVPGLPQEIYERTLVTLDGSQSYDPDGQIVSWQWSQVTGPAVMIESPNAAMTLFRAPDVAPGGADLRFQLEVWDNAGNHADGTVSVHVFDQRDRRNLLIWRSPPGDYIGGGMPLTFTSDDGDVTLGNAYQAQPPVQASFQGGAFNSWVLDFAAPNGAALTHGTYTGAQRFPFQAPGAPGLAVYGSGRGCNTLTGQFTVLEIDQPIAPTQFGARFVQSCEGFMPALRGTVLVNAIAPGDPIARIAGTAFASPGAIATLDGSGSSSIGSSLVAYKWRQLAGSPVSIDNPTLPQIAFSMPSNATGPLQFELEVDDEDGLVGVVRFDVASVATVATPIPTIDRGVVLLLAMALGVSGLFLIGLTR